MDAAEEYARRIRDVFDLFDSDKRGFITVERFAEVAREHFGAGNADDGNSPEVTLCF
jgi:Ca2+-binding EF-hand superfamily protein